MELIQISKRIFRISVKEREAAIKDVLKRYGPLTKREIYELLLKKYPLLNRRSLHFWITYMRIHNRISIYNKRDCLVSGYFQCTYILNTMLEAGGQDDRATNETHI